MQNQIECVTCIAAKKQLQSWLDQQGHERCWYYSEIFQKLASLFGVQQSAKSGLPTRAEFKEGCRQFQDEEYGPDLK